MSFNTIPEILEDIRAGRMVVILDDEDRENEGDLIMAAQMVRPEDINFMVREARGLVCLTLTEQRTRQLGLRPMVVDNTSPYQTNFTVSIEAAEGVTTGISAHDRARTIQVAVKSDAKAQDLSQPGHIFPLTAQPGGVLTRAGHTEAGCDLAALAGLEPSAVLIEILHEDGSMARRPELEIFAKKHGLKIGSIADLIRYRLETEKTVQRVYEEDVQTEFGPFRLVAYRDAIRQGLHFALVRGTVHDGEPVLTRVHVRNTLSDVLHLQRDDLGLTVTAALRRIGDAVPCWCSRVRTPPMHCCAASTASRRRRRRRKPSSRSGASWVLARRSLPTWASASCVCWVRRARWWVWVALASKSSNTSDRPR
jgi:3,4-dihydroxy 2-butanone 4-phosphate synthase/GTP cyclohydrolase II